MLDQVYSSLVEGDLRTAKPKIRGSLYLVGLVSADPSDLGSWAWGFRFSISTTAACQRASKRNGVHVEPSEWLR